MSKLISIDRALEFFSDGCEIMYGGFGGLGSPPTLIDALLEAGCSGLRLIGNDAGFPEVGMGRLISAERAQSLITTHIGSNPNAGRLMQEGKLKVSFYPQGIFAEKIRARGVGLPGILVEPPSQPCFTASTDTVMIAGKTCLVEPALGAEIGIVYARAADEYGNLVFDKSARNFNPAVAMAADLTIAEVEEIVPLGELDPEAIVVPGVFVNYLVQSQGVRWKWAWESKSAE